MHDMSTDELRRFLEEGTRTGKVATVRADGTPHAAPVWFVLDGDDLVFTTFTTTVKARNLRRDPRACVTVDDQVPPFSFATLTGTATLSGDHEELYRIARRIAVRYMGEDLADDFARRNAVDGELVVRFTPRHVVAKAAMAG